MSYAPFKALSLYRTAFICLVILLSGLLFTQVIFSTEPEAEREAATKKTAMLVEVIDANQGDFQPFISAMGTVLPAEQVALKALVRGQIVALGENFIPGGFVNQGDLLVEIESADYRLQLQQRQSELEQALSALAIEKGEQEAARLDYLSLNRELTGMQKELILRQPQLRAAEAKVAAAKAAVAQAQLDLQRTQIVAPFDAQIINRGVDIGSSVSTNDTLTELVGLQNYWIEASLPLTKVQWLQRPTAISEGSKVTLRNRTGWPKDASRSGILKSVIGSLENNTRMARVIIEVEDPLAQQPHNNNAPPLFVGSYVESLITARTLTDVVKLPRQYLRKGNTTWVMENNALSIRDLQVVFFDSDFAYVSEGLTGGEKIVTTNISRIREGAELRLKETNELAGAQL